MKKIIAFAGSNSKNSINNDLATYASSLIKDVEISVLDLNDFELPLYGIDFEIEHGIPDNALKFLDHIKSSDGIILSLAEHNGAYSAVFKNIFDWMSRAEKNVWYDKPMLLMAASPGGRGGQSVLEIAQGKFPRMGANITGVFSLPFFQKNFSEGKIIDEELNNHLKQVVSIFSNVI
ncbi:MAG: NAD(P)H-dependent oxidoreductase [Flavobacteriaceae bacterium]|nr:NAD(P)H-dependent oxidoreductase [Bacteroidia bacterium]NNL16090.1 NAD(P)H-dependent oxidoreductase [Flavobacteriaceae bacterium]